MDNAVNIAIVARAPIPGTAKTRLIPMVGPHGAARLHRQMVLRTLQTAEQANLGGSVVIWGTPTRSHRFFRALEKLGVTCREQPGGDLGERMRHVFNASLPRPTLLVGTDCPSMTPEHLRAAARALVDGDDAVFLPAEDGGYVLIGLRSPARELLFEGLSWGTSSVMEETRRRLGRLGYSWSEPATLWDIDNPEDLVRLAEMEQSSPSGRDIRIHGFPNEVAEATPTHSPTLKKAFALQSGV